MSFPGKAARLWGFTVCGGVAAFRPTAAVMQMFDDLSFWCRWNCDDQIQVNNRLMQYHIEWYDTNQTATEQFYPENTIPFHKVGRTTTNVYTLLMTNLI